MTCVATNAPAQGRLARALPGRLAASPLVALLAVYGIALAWTLVVQLPLLHLDRIDEVFYAEVARLWTRGVVPYAGAFDVKPPGFFALVAASQSVFGPSPASVRAVAIALDAVTATALFFLGRSLAPRVGLFAAIAYPPLSELVCFNDFYSALAASTTLAFLAALSPLRLAGRAALTGLAVGAALCIKQTAAFEALVLFFTIVGALDAAGRRTTAALAFVSGASIVPFGFLAYFAWHGAAQALIDDAVVGALMRPASAAEGLTFIDGVLLFLPLHRSILGLIRGRLPRVAAPSRACRRPTRRAARGSRSLAACGAARDPGAAVVARRLCQPDVAACAAAGGPLRGARDPGIWSRARMGAVGRARRDKPRARTRDFRRPPDANRHPTRAIAEATAAIRATGPSAADRLFAVNGGLWLNAATGPRPSNPIYSSFAYLMRIRPQKRGKPETTPLPQRRVTSSSPTGARAFPANARNGGTRSRRRCATAIA